MILNKNEYEVNMVDHSRIQSLYGELHEDTDETNNDGYLKRKCNIHLMDYIPK